eukprot:PhM_4_TR3407/c1_g1_i1/m.83333
MFRTVLLSVSKKRVSSAKCSAEALAKKGMSLCTTPSTLYVSDMCCKLDGQTTMDGETNKQMVARLRRAYSKEPESVHAQYTARAEEHRRVREVARSKFRDLSMSGYSLFTQRHLHGTIMSVAKEMSGTRKVRTEALSRIGALWKLSSDAERAAYCDEAKVLRDRAREQLEELFLHMDDSLKKS